MSPRFSLTLIGAGLGLAISAAAFTTATFTQRLIPIEWAALLLAGTTGTGAVVGRVSDRRNPRPGLVQSEVMLPHSPEDPENAGLYRKTVTTIATHLCQVPPGTEEYQEALIAGSTVTANLRSALVGEAPRTRWQEVMERWQSADASSGTVIDPISGAALFPSPVQQEESNYEPETPPTTADSGGSVVPELPSAFKSFLVAGRSSTTPNAPVDEPVATSAGTPHPNGSSFNLDDEWDQPIASA